MHLRRARDLIDRDYAEPLDLDTLAAEATVSKYHFLRCFAATYGKTPAVYLAERRIERAQDLLRATNLTVTEVCMLVGYSSLGSFSSKFRELVGVSPSGVPGELPGRGAPHPRLLRLHARVERSPRGQVRKFGEAVRAT